MFAFTNGVKIISYRPCEPVYHRSTQTLATHNMDTPRVILPKLTNTHIRKHKYTHARMVTNASTHMRALTQLGLDELLVEQHRHPTSVLSLRHYLEATPRG